MKRSNSTFLRGVTLVTFSRIFGYALSFVRNVVLARVLAKADFGLASAFATTVMMLEISARFGLPQLVIQSPRGDSPTFVASLHGVQLLAGSVSAVLLLALSHSMAVLFSAPSAAWGFAALALIPITNSFGHLDNARAQKHLNFLPISLTEIIPQVIVTAVVWPVTCWFPDYRSIVILMLSKSVIAQLISHTLAKQPYRIRWARQDLIEIAPWAWPFALSALVVFGSQQASQMVIGGAYSVSELAGYAISVSLVNVPWFIIGNVATSVALPFLARAKSDPRVFVERVRIYISLSTVVAVLFLIPFSLLGGDLVKLIYGKAYGDCGQYVLILALGIALRIFGTAGSLVAIARGDPRNELFANIWRCVSLPLSLVIVRYGNPPIAVAGCILVGEAFGLCASLFRLREVLMENLKEFITSTCYLIGFAGFTVCVIVGGASKMGFGTEVGVSITLIVVALLSAAMVFPRLVATVQELIPSFCVKLLPERG